MKPSPVKFNKWDFIPDSLDYCGAGGYAHFCTGYDKDSKEYYLSAVCSTDPVTIVCGNVPAKFGKKGPFCEDSNLRLVTCVNPGNSQSQALACMS